MNETFCLFEAKRNRWLKRFVKFQDKIPFQEVAQQGTEESAL